MSSWLNRWGSTNVPIFGFFAAIWGAFALTSPASSYGSPVYAYLWDIAPRPAWGVLMLVAGGAAALSSSVLATALLCFSVAALAAATTCAAVQLDNVPAQAPILSLAIAVSLAVSVARRGVSG